MSLSLQRTVNYPPQRDSSTAPVLEPVEHDLELVALSIEAASWEIGAFRFTFEGMQAAIFRPALYLRIRYGALSSGRL